MSTIKVNTITNNGSAVDLPSGAFSIGGSSIVQNYTASATQPTSPSAGDIWWDSANSTYYVYINGEFKEIGIVIPPLWYGDRGVIGGGLTTDLTNVISYFDITTTGNATDFGDLTVARQASGGLSNSSRGVFAGGASTNVMDYITIATPSNATDFGDLLQNAAYAVGTCDSSRGVIWRQASDLEYISVDTAGNSTQFGTIGGSAYNAGWNDSTRSIFANGSTSAAMNYVTIQTTGNATSFGNLTASRQRLAGCGDGTYAIFGGGENNPPATGNSNVLDYVTIQTTGNATDFGDMLSATQRPAATSNGTRGCWAGGEVGSNINVIQYVTVTTPSNATDFGDLTHSVGFAAGLSGAAA